MPALRYMELNLMQIYDVLRAAPCLYLAVCGDAQPYVIPMHYQLEVIASRTVLHLAAPEEGRKMDALRRNRHVCALIIQPACAWTDTVVIDGMARLGAAQGPGTELLLHAQHLTGRRYFLPDG